MPKTYHLCLESGPQRKKTVVHVVDLLGCILTGATTDEAVAAAPEMIRTYLRFLERNGENVDPRAPFETTVEEESLRGGFLFGAFFESDLKPVSAKDIETCLGRFHAMRETLASWAERATPKQLAEMSADGTGRPSEKVLLHLLTGPGAYLGAALGGSKGFSAVGGAVERGEMSVADGLRKVEAMATEVVRATTRQQRSAVVHRSNDVRTLRKALRQMLEHDWDHLAEIARRPGGPKI